MLFLTYLLLLLISMHADDARMIKKRQLECVPTVKILNCENGGVKRRSYYTYEQEAEIEPGCYQNTISTIRWELFDVVRARTTTLPLYDDKKVAHIGTKGMAAADYNLKVYVHEENGGSAEDSCLLQYNHEPPVLIFKEGRSQTVDPKDVLTVDLSPSKHVEPGELEWEIMPCQAVSYNYEEMCHFGDVKDLVKGYILEIKNVSCIASMTVTVSTIFDDRVITESQHVTIKELSTKMNILCAVNCDLAENDMSDASKSISVIAECLKGCDFDPDQAVWTIKKNGADVELQGETIDKLALTIDPNTLPEDSEVPITLKIAGEFRAMRMIKTIPPMTPPVCKVEPPEGYSASTIFKISCDFKDKYYQLHPPMMHVFRKENDKSTLIRETASHVLTTYLNTDSDQAVIQIKIIDEILYKDVAVDDIIVKLTTRPVDDNKVTQMLYKAETLAHEGNVGLATALLDAAVEDAQVNDDTLSKDVIMDVYKNTTNILSELDVDTVSDYKLVMGTIEKLVDVHSSDKDLRSAISKICKAMANMKLDNLMVSKYQKTQIPDIPEFYQQVENCASYLIEITEEEEGIKQKEKENEETIEVVDYKDYDELFLGFDSKHRTMAALGILLSTSRAIGMSISKDNPFNATGKLCDRKILKQDGALLGGNVVSFEGASIEIAGRFENHRSEEVTSLAMKCSRKLLDPNILSTDFIDMGYYDQGANQLTGGFKATFDLYADSTEFQFFTVITPSREASWNNATIDYLMNVHRISLPGKSSCYIKFVIEPDVKIQVVITKNVRPKLQDFSEAAAVTIDSSDNTNLWMKCPVDVSEKDQFVYVAVLPHRDMLKGNKLEIFVEYKVQFSEQKCVMFDKLELIWKPSDCKVIYHPYKEKSQIACICGHTSLLGATHNLIENKLDEVIIVNYKTAPFFNYIIFMHVAVVFICYCLAMCFLPCRSNTTLGREKVIFLSDNRKNDRYGYFLVVKTGNYPLSGTTSNVVLRLYGQKSNSKRHVLNYPDPDKKLLQRNNSDWFVLTNEVHLGDILSVEIWIDSIGYRPPWYCEEITVVDMQTEKEWHFQVDSWLSVTTEKSFSKIVHEHRILSNKEQFLSDIKKHARFYFGAEHTWNIFCRSLDDSFSYHERLTVILSHIYTTYVLLVLFLGPPEWRTYDAYGYGNFVYQHEFLIYIFCSSLLSGCGNFILAYFFRNSKKETNKYSLILSQPTYGNRALFITWVIVYSWILACSTYLLLVGFWLPHNTSLVWMFCSTMSLICSIFLVENILIVLVKLVKKVSRRFYDMSAIILEIDRQRKVLFKQFGEYMMRPYFRMLYKKMTWDTYVKRKRHFDEYSEVVYLLKNMCMVLGFIILVWLVARFTAADDAEYISNHDMVLMLEGTFNRSNMSMSDIKTTKDVYNYLRNTLSAAVNPEEWYGGLKNSEGLMIDFTTKILGVVQLRQQRRSQVCEVPYSLRGLRGYCWNDNDYIDTFKYHKRHGLFSFIGVLDTYYDEGYIVHLGKTPRNTLYVLEVLEANNWIDINTKVLFIDFWAYNPSTNNFILVTVCIERDESGRFLISTMVTILRLIVPSMLVGIIMLLFVIILIILLVLSTASMVGLIVKKKMKFVYNLWNILDAIMLGLIFAIVVIFFIKNQRTDILLRTLEQSNHNEYVNFFALLTLLKTNNVLVAILLFLSTIRLWKYVNFVSVFQLMERTLIVAGPDLLIIMFLQLYVNFSFAFLFYLVLGTDVVPFNGIMRSLLSFYLSSKNFLRGYHIGKLASEEGMLVAVIYVAFMVVTIVFYSLFSSILIKGFISSKIHYSNKHKCYSIKDFFVDQFRYKRERIRWDRRLRGGGNLSVRYVTPKDDAHRYADCSLMSEDKMETMRMIAISVIRSTHKLANVDKATFDMIKAMKTMKDQKTTSSTPNMYFTAKDVQNDKYKFVSDVRLLQMEFVTERILRHDSIETEETEPSVIRITGDAERLASYRNTIDLIARTVQNIKLDII